MQVQLDSITHNELGDPSALAAVQDRPDVPGIKAWEAQPGLGLLNLAYDAMPADFVSQGRGLAAGVGPRSIGPEMNRA